RRHPRPRATARTCGHGAPGHLDRVPPSAVGPGVAGEILLSMRARPGRPGRNPALDTLRSGTAREESCSRHAQERGNAGEILLSAEGWALGGRWPAARRGV